jgi:hypothetical protein
MHYSKVARTCTSLFNFEFFVMPIHCAECRPARHRKKASFLAPSLLQQLAFGQTGDKTDKHKKANKKLNRRFVSLHDLLIVSIASHTNQNNIQDRVLLLFCTTESGPKHVGYVSFAAGRPLKYAICRVIITRRTRFLILNLC